jgi:excisionase family DNA binding protein
MNEGREKGSMVRLSSVTTETVNRATPSEPLLRPSQVAQLLACSTKTVYGWAASGFLPCVRLGRLVRFKAGDVRQFVEAHAENPQAR